MYDYYIINILIRSPLSKLDGANSEALAFKTIESAKNFIQQSNIPDKENLRIMTWSEFLKL
jgi:hypothetical protein